MKRKFFTICFALTFVAACGLSGLKQPTHAEQSTTTDYDQEIRQAEEEKKKAEGHLENLEEDLKNWKRVKAIF